MRIACLGDGPAGLYSAYLLAQQGNRVTVFERPQAASGWGVVVGRQMLYEELDAELARCLAPTLHAWQEIDIYRGGEHTRIGGQDFFAIARSDLLTVLRQLCLRYGVQFTDSPTGAADQVCNQLAQDNDLILACDGLHSGARQAFSTHFQAKLEYASNRYLWLGLRGQLPAFTFAFVETPFGWMQLHAYQFRRAEMLTANDDVECASTCIIEMSAEVWQRAGFAEMSIQASVAMCQAWFATYLAGAEFVPGSCRTRQDDIQTTEQLGAWQQFAVLNCENWWLPLTVGARQVPLVLVGDAAHSAHFSIGSGTRMAMADARALAEVLRQLDSLPSSEQLHAQLNTYQHTQQSAAKRLQNAARNSMQWFEQIALYAKLPFAQFAYSLLTRSQRLLHHDLQQRDPAWLQSFLADFCRDARPPMFTTLRVREVELSNRVVVSPMAQYAAEQGVVADYHLMHLGSLASGGAGLVMTEMLAVSKYARITPQCAGLYTEEHVQAWRRIVDFVHQTSHAKIGAQLGHAGPKGACVAPHAAIKGSSSLIYDQPLAQADCINLPWPLVAASRMQYWRGVSQWAAEISVAEMQTVIADFVASTKAAQSAGFDWLELHCAHGYLLSSFLSPITNLRTDEFGGSVAARCRFPLEVFRAMRAVWPCEKPLSVRLSVMDWLEGGNTIEQAIEIGQLFAAAGVDVITCSSGQVSRDEQVRYGRMYQTPFAERIRLACGVLTMAVGAIEDGDQVNTIIAAGRADLCAIGRPHLANPRWTLQQAALQAYAAQPWPASLHAARSQAEKQAEKLVQTLKA